MKQVIRKGVFETNSSSAHAFAFLKKDDEDFSLYEKKVNRITDNEEKMLVLLTSCSHEGLYGKKDFVSWLQYRLEEYFPTWSDAYSFVEDLIELGDKQKVIEALKSHKGLNLDFILSKLEPEYEYVTADPYEAFLDNTFTTENIGLLSALEAKQKVNEAIKAYAEYIGEPVKKLEKLFAEEYCSRDDCYCGCLFYEGALVDCDCDVEDLSAMVPSRYKTIKDLVLALMNDEIVIFQAEEYGASYCTVRYLVKEKRIW